MPQGSDLVLILRAAVERAGLQDCVTKRRTI
jgi:hypothetical protein